MQSHLDVARMAFVGVLDDLLADQVEANRRTARRADGIREVLVMARANPYVYTDLSVELPGDLAVRAAENAAVLDLSLRLQLPDGQVRALSRIAEAAISELPALWRRALDGFAPFPLVEASVSAALRLRPPLGADATTVATAREAIAILDAATSEWVVTLTPAAFRRRLRILVDRLDPAEPAVRHTQALTDRRVVVEEGDDGMSWLMVLMPTIDAIAARRRLTSTAKHLQKDARDGRSRDQIRADLASAWLRGVGTATAVKTKVFVTIPIGVLSGTGTGAGAGHDRRCTVCGGSGFAEQARIVGHDTIDPLTAKQLFLDAKAFRRVITDPVSGVVVDMDRRTYRPTRAQRDWLVLQHGTCARDGCSRLALDADIDHEVEWAAGGRTDLARLRPLCPADHHRRHNSRIRYRSRSDGSVEVATPTGFTSSEPPPF
jgi:hypothetical protein